MTVLKTERRGFILRLTMRLSDARLRQRQTKMLYPSHLLPPWLTEDAARDRSNRLLGTCVRIKDDPSSERSALRYAVPDE